MYWTCWLTTCSMQIKSLHLPIGSHITDTLLQNVAVASSPVLLQWVRHVLIIIMTNIDIYGNCKLRRVLCMGEFPKSKNDRS